MDEKRFYDIHMHLMNLSHLNIMAILKRVDKWGLTDSKIKLVAALLLVVMFFPIVMVFLLIYAVKSAFCKTSKVTRFMNLLSFAENDIGSMLLTLENYMTDSKLCKYAEDLYDGEKLTIGGKRYDRLVLSPLMMDFGYKNTNKGKIYFSNPANKPIAEQVVDLFLGIRNYNAKSKLHLFDVQPFMGLNTRNYSYDKLVAMLDKYFVNDDHKACTETFDGDIDQLGCNCFAGIKVYPPLGFDPWPDGSNVKGKAEKEDEAKELRKVEYLYRFCCDRGIPITTHCSSGGYRVVQNKTALLYTHPKRWAKVFKATDETGKRKYTNLKLNFAHRVNPTSDVEWTRGVLTLMKHFDNVYADFSYVGTGKTFYDDLQTWLQELDEDLRDKVKARILFGTDFTINLMDSDSYNQYLSRFSNSGLIEADIDRYGRINPERFLYSKSVSE